MDEDFLTSRTVIDSLRGAAPVQQAVVRSSKNYVGAELEGSWFD
jgi:hypothetical protein